MHMQSIALLHSRPQTHVHLGLALAEVGEIDWSIRAFQTALSMQSENALAHHCLAQLYERARPDRQLTQFHRDRARQIRISGNG
jgi:lipoprotein NlpI